MTDETSSEFGYTMRTILLMEKEGKWQWRWHGKPYNECPLFETRAEAQDWVGPLGELKIERPTSIIVPK